MSGETRISIARIYYPVTVLGPGRRVGIWTTGCTKNCEGCVSPELRNHDETRLVSISTVIHMIRSIKGEIDGFTLSGGEPFYDPKALCMLVSGLTDISDDILIYTGYTLDELKSMRNNHVDKILSLCSVLIDGPYIREKNDGIGLRGSSNQQVHIFRNKEKYKGIGEIPRQYQTIVYKDSLLAIGIPFGDDK